MIKLSPRLQIIYDMVSDCDVVCDVGCDHGYLSIALLQGKKAVKAIAMDINKGPLEAAKTNVEAAHLASQVDFRLSDGLMKLDESEADVICICGMGGALIARILAAGIDVVKKAKAVIIEPQSEYAAVRRFLVENDMLFLDEELCSEEGKIYPIIKFCYSRGNPTACSETDLEYGPVIIKKRPKLLMDLLEKKQSEYLAIMDRLNSISDKSGEKDSPIQLRKNEISKELELISNLRTRLEE